MVWKGSSGSTSKSYSIPAGTKYLVIIVSSGYGNGAGSQSTQMSTSVSISFAQNPISTTKIINSNGTKTGTFYSYSTIANLYELDGTANTVTLKSATSGSMLYHSSMVVYM